LFGSVLTTSSLLTLFSECCSSFARATWSLSVSGARYCFPSLGWKLISHVQITFPNNSTLRTTYITLKVGASSIRGGLLILRALSTEKDPQLFLNSLRSSEIARQVPLESRKLKLRGCHALWHPFPGEFAQPSLICSKAVQKTLQETTSFPTGTCH